MKISLNSKAKIISLLSLAVFLTSLSACQHFIKQSERSFVKFQEKAYVYDAIIVPGVPLVNGAWDRIMKTRVLWAVYLFKKGICNNIIFSGGAVYSPFYESIAMKLYAQQLGVPSSRIYCDTLAQHSTENVFYSYILAGSEGFKTIALATDPVQSFMLKDFTFHRFASRIDHIPIAYSHIQKDFENLELSIDPSIAFRPGFISIMTNQTGKDRFAGTMGKNLNFGQRGFLDKL